MMHGSGGSQIDLSQFEGLVRATARKFAAQVKWDEGDLEQELRVRVWRAVETYSTSRAKGTLEKYVFMAVTNKIKDYKRDAAREADRRERYGISFSYIEDTHMPAAPSSMEGTGDPREVFDAYHNFVTRDEIYGEIEEGKFVLPSSVTRLEANVLMLLMMEMTRTEVALRLGLSRMAVEALVNSLREKFSDWEPTQRANSSQTVAIVELAA